MNFLVVAAIVLAALPAAAQLQVFAPRDVDEPVFGLPVPSDIAALAWNGTHHVMVFRTDTNPGFTGAEIYLARVGDDGHPVDPEGSALSLRAADHDPVRIACTPAVCLAIWVNDGNSNDVVGARMDASGAVLDEAPFPIARGPGWQRSPSIASDGDGFFVVWGDDENGTVEGARVGAAGDVVDYDPIVVAASPATTPAVAFDGTSFVVAWISDAAFFQGGLRVTRVSPAGVVVDAAGVEVTATTDLTAQRPAIAVQGAVALVAWHGGQGKPGVFFARVTDGVVADPGGAILSEGDQASDVDVAVAGDGFVVTFIDRRDGSGGVDFSPRDEKLVARFVPTTGPVVDDDVVLVDVPSGKSAPSVSSSGTAGVLVYADDVSGERHVVGTSIDLVALALGAPPAALSGRRASNRQARPDIATLGAGYLVVWDDDRSEQGLDVYARRVDARGAPLGDAFLVDEDEGFAERPRAVGGADGAIIAWRATLPGTADGGRRVARAVRVDALGAVLDDDPLLVSSNAADCTVQAVEVARGHGIAVAVAAEEYIGSDVPRLRAFVVEDGVVTATALPLSDPQRALGPAIVATQSGFFLVWLEDRFSSATIWGARLDATGVSSSIAAIEIDDVPTALYTTTDGDLATARLAGDARGDEVFVTWDTGVQARAALVETDDDVSSVAVASGTIETAPVVALRAADALVAWSGNAGVSARLLAGTSTTVPSPTQHQDIASLAIARIDDRHLALVGAVEETAAPYFSHRVRVWPVIDEAAPTATGASLTVVEDGAATALPFAGSDADADPLTYRVVSGPTSGTIVDGGYVPAPDFAGQDALMFVADDGLQESAPATISITVTPVPDAPVFVAPTPDGPLAAEVGARIAFTLAATDADGDALTYAVTPMPTGAELTGGAFTWTPRSAGTTTLELSASDGARAATRGVVVTVTGEAAPTDGGAGSSADGGDGDDAGPGGEPPGGGCACATTSTPDTALPLLALGLLWAARRSARRSRAGRPLVVAAPAIAALVLSLPAGAQDDCELPAPWQPSTAVSVPSTAADWRADAPSFTTRGRPAVVDLRGDPLVVTGESLAATASIAAPYVLEVHAAGPAALQSLYVEDAVVEGVGTGTLVLVGAALAVTEGAWTSAALSSAETAADGVRLEPAADGAGALALTLTAPFADAQAAAGDTTRIDDVTAPLTIAFDRGVLVTAGGEVAVTSPARITAATALRVPRSADALGAALRVRTTAAVSVTASAVALGGDVDGGSVTIDGVAMTPRPTSVFLGAATVALSPAVATTSARLTQAISDEQLLVPATVEVALGETFVHLGQNGRRRIDGVVRETTALGDAVLDAITVEGCGAGIVQDVIVEGVGFVELYVLVMQRTIALDPIGFTAPFVVLAFAPLIGVAVFADLIGSFLCSLFGCSSATPPRPYPAWLGAGNVAEFHLLLHAEAEPGDYPTRIRFAGKNHEDVVVDVLIRVGRGDVPDDWTCAATRWGAYDGCDCGCGEVDRDCADDSVAACERTWCGPAGTLGGVLEPGSTTACDVPDGWRCVEPYFDSGDGCDCGCGIVDPDCGPDAEYYTCDYVWCAANGRTGGAVDPDDLAACAVVPDADAGVDAGDGGDAASGDGGSAGADGGGASVADGGVVEDEDAGTGGDEDDLDAGSGDAGPNGDDGAGGCACDSARGTAAEAALLLPLLALLRRRRREAAGHVDASASGGARARAPGDAPAPRAP